MSARQPGSRKVSAATRDPMFNQSVEKAFAVLGAFDAGKSVLNLAEIAAAARITPSSALRSIHTLVALGYLVRNDRLHGWVLAPRTLSVGYPYLAHHGVIEVATPHLVNLNQACGESVSLSEPDGTEMVFIARFASHKPFFIHMPVGRRLPMYCTSAGRAYLSTLPREEVREVLRRSTLRALTPHTLTQIPQILEIIDSARELGYAWASEECYRGDLTIGAPIIGPGGRAIAAINISGPTSRWTSPDLRARLTPLLLETARAASGNVAAATRMHATRRDL
jgi:DNA-binding IclR family transcriptional regulator